MARLAIHCQPEAWGSLNHVQRHVDPSIDEDAGEVVVCELRCAFDVVSLHIPDSAHSLDSLTGSYPHGFHRKSMSKK